MTKCRRGHGTQYQRFAAPRQVWWHHRAKLQGDQAAVPTDVDSNGVYEKRAMESNWDAEPGHQNMSSGNTKTKSKGKWTQNPTGLRRSKWEDQSAVWGIPPVVGRTAATNRTPGLYKQGVWHMAIPTISMTIQESHEQMQEQQQQLDKVEHTMVDQQINLVHIEKEIQDGETSTDIHMTCRSSGTGMSEMTIPKFFKREHNPMEHLRKIRRYYKRRQQSYDTRWCRAALRYSRVMLGVLCFVVVYYGKNGYPNLRRLCLPATWKI